MSKRKLANSAGSWFLVRLVVLLSVVSVLRGIAFVVLDYQASQLACAKGIPKCLEEELQSEGRSEIGCCPQKSLSY
eukprot:476261-Amphidinium_carterae.1